MDYKLDDNPHRRSSSIGYENYVVHKEQGKKAASGPRGKGKAVSSAYFQLGKDDGKKANYQQYDVNHDGDGDGDSGEHSSSYSYGSEHGDDAEGDHDNYHHSQSYANDSDDGDDDGDADSHSQSYHKEDAGDSEEYDDDE